jgi:hypothetical protein
MFERKFSGITYISCPDPESEISSLTHNHWTYTKEQDYKLT